MTTTFYFIRHGESLANAQNRLCGHADWDLTERGREQAKRTAQLLADIPGAARRCDACAEALRNGTALPDAMAQADFLPPAESTMLSLGLRQGSGDRVMEDIADRLLEAAMEELERTVARIEPAMVLAASALVGVILLAVMLPLMNILSALG